jgi:hypothetical protein
MAAALIFLLGLALRSAWPARMAVEHFDEGVYASNLFAVLQQPPHAYPDRHLYAPPLVPALLEWAMILSGGDPRAVLWVNVVAGSLTVLVVWWTAREWFGRAAGIAAALLAATSEYHIAFSRTALTDPLLCLWMTAGVYAGWRAVLTGRPQWLLAAGVLAALAWWTKYNGWLVLAITGAGTVAWLLARGCSAEGRDEETRSTGDEDRSSAHGRDRVDPGASPHPLTTSPPLPALRLSPAAALTHWAAAGLIALLLWLPFLWTLPPDSSYSEIAANHSKYFVGLGGWWTSFARQVGAHRHLDGWAACGGVALALLGACALSRGGFTWNGSGSQRLGVSPAAAVQALALMLLAVLLGSSVLLAVLGGAGLVLALRAPWPMLPGVGWAAPTSPTRANSWWAQPTLRSGEGCRLPHEGRGTRLAGWMLAAWFIGLLAATPLYHPYPRLSLPWLVSGWLAAAAMLGALAEGRCLRSTGGTTSVSGSRSILLAGVVLIAAIVGAAWIRGAPLGPATGVAWEDRTGLKAIAPRILEDVQRIVHDLPPSQHLGIDAVIYVYAEPALYFQLEAAAGSTPLRYVAHPAGNLGLLSDDRTDSRVATFLIAGPHADRMVEGSPAPASLTAVPEAARYEYRASDLVRLDEYPASAVARPDELPPDIVRLFLVHAPRSE